MNAMILKSENIINTSPIIGLKRRARIVIILFSVLLTTAQLFPISEDPKTSNRGYHTISMEQSLFARTFSYEYHVFDHWNVRFSLGNWGEQTIGFAVVNGLLGKNRVKIEFGGGVAVTYNEGITSMAGIFNAGLKYQPKKNGIVTRLGVKFMIGERLMDEILVSWVVSFGYRFK